MISNQQKRMIHQYVRLSGINDQSYRGLLTFHTGCRSSADSNFTQRHFDQLMAAIEQEIELQYIAGAIPDPVKSGAIRRLDYWRTKSAGASSRQLWQIKRLRAQIELTDDYCLAIISHAAGGSRPPSLATITQRQAAALIDALADKVNHV